MKLNRVFIVVLAVLLGFGLFNVSLALADGDVVQAELQADAEADDAVSDFPGVEGGIVCDPGEIPAQIYFSDFEADDGGWVVTSTAAITDTWEWGTIVTGTYDLCGGPDDEPSGAYSGQNVWGTNLDGCHPNLGGEMYLSQTFDLSALDGPIEMTYQHWYEVFESFDWAKLFVNGDELWRTPDSSPTADWIPNAVDLSAYAGQSSVTVAWELHATTVVNRMGLYVDDVAVTACRAPTDVSLTSFGDSSAAGAPGIWLWLVAVTVPLLVGAVALRRRQAVE